MQYLVDWRIALAKAMLQRDSPPAAIGYQSASAFSTAFRREVGRARWWASMAAKIGSILVGLVAVSMVMHSLGWRVRNNCVWSARG